MSTIYLAEVETSTHKIRRAHETLESARLDCVVAIKAWLSQWSAPDRNGLCPSVYDANADWGAASIQALRSIALTGTPEDVIRQFTFHMNNLPQYPWKGARVTALELVR